MITIHNIIIKFTTWTTSLALLVDIGVVVTTVHNTNTTIVAVSKQNWTRLTFVKPSIHFLPSWQAWCFSQRPDNHPGPLLHVHVHTIPQAECGLSHCSLASFPLSSFPAMAHVPRLANSAAWAYGLGAGRCDRRVVTVSCPQYVLNHRASANVITSSNTGGCSWYWIKQCYY